MATIRRHPVPIEFYEPDRPLNDLGRDQLKHFAHIAEHLPSHLKVGVPVPSPESGIAASQFIAAVTERLMSTRKTTLKLVSKRKPKAPSAGLAIAAGADTSVSSQVSRARQGPPAKRKPGERGV